MYQSPNENNTLKRNQRNDSFSLGNNNLRARFKKALYILLSTEYYEGSKYGKVYNTFRDDGRSEIYVDQPALEERLQKKLIDAEEDVVKFLVGPTGVGKTTLIRNMFHVFDRDIVVIDNNLIVYASFYSMTSYMKSSEEINVIVQDVLIGALNGAISYLDDSDYVDRLNSYDDAYYNDFYDFIKLNNKHLIQTVPDISRNVEKLQNVNSKKFILDWINENKPIDYHMCQLKYYLYLYKRHTNTMFDNIILILDDTESLPPKYANTVMEYAYHAKKCMQANYKREYNFKVLISMRNYSYRIEQIRRKEAFREIAWEDVILKDSVPNLSKILDKRMECVLKSEEILNSVDDIVALKNAADSLKVVLKKMYGQYDNMLLSLTHNNIFKSMTLLIRILTNKSHMGKYEVDRLNKDGAFEFSAKHYHVENHSTDSSIPGNDDVYFALVYGEEKFYFDREDYYLTNIMHYKKKEETDTELLGIYIIQYFIKKRINLSDKKYDGFESLSCTKVIEDIISLYSFPTDDKDNNIKRGLQLMMKHLYQGGVLLQSLIEPIKEDSLSTQREYVEEMKVFLSLRGNQLYKMLSYNALLLTTYRDDIDTNIENNDVPTLDLSMNDRMLYCIKYIDYLWKKEIELLRSVVNYKKYKEILGNDLAVVILMRGIRETIKTYYTSETLFKQEIIQQYKLVQSKINSFLDSIFDETQIVFKHVESI